MASFAPSKLTSLQRDVLDAFFQRERGFFLTGGAALAGFHLGHRTTDDLDLFTSQDGAFERGRSADEILANKLTALVDRAEERDLVDVMFLERAGYSLENALAAALAKDGGCTPATIAWLLSEVSIPDGISLPAGVTADGVIGGQKPDLVEQAAEGAPRGSGSSR
jgi:hypothetical protein